MTDHCVQTNITVSLRTNATERVFAVVFISFDGDVRLFSLKIKSAWGLSHPIIEKCNRMTIDNYSEVEKTKLGSQG